MSVCYHFTYFIHFNVIVDHLFIPDQLSMLSSADTFHFFFAFFCPDWTISFSILFLSPVNDNQFFLSSNQSWPIFFYLHKQRHLFQFQFISSNFLISFGDLLFHFQFTSSIQLRCNQSKSNSKCFFSCFVLWPISIWINRKFFSISRNCVTLF